MATQRKALRIVSLVDDALHVDRNLVNVGALLHDIGRALVHDITHGFRGANILRQKGFPEQVALVVERHVLGGFTASEARRIGLPPRSFLPTSWEEKIVCVADKLGHFWWPGINDPTRWLSKVQERFSALRRMYGGGEPYETSMRRAEQYTMELVHLVRRKVD